jgi:regulation of enolase protein 1 (concanavalin A-like superfamily)
VEGEYLDKQHVAEVYITDGTTDWKVEVLKQTATQIEFKIPANAKPGRFFLMVLTAGPDPKLIEEPVRVTIEGEAAQPS